MNWINFSGDSDRKEFTCNARDLGSILGWGRSPEAGNGYPLQYSCLENSMDLVGYSPRGRKTVGCNWATKHKQQNINWMVEVSILSWGDYPGLSRWAQCNQRVFKSVRKEHKTVSEKEMWQQKQGQRRAVLQALKMEEGCQEPRNLGSFLKLQETRRWTLF